MNIKLNGKITDINPGVSLQDVLTRLGLEPGGAVVQRNGTIIDRDALAQIIVKENDELEILRFVGGG